MKIPILSPKTIFLLDGLGAALTAILLITVVSIFNPSFGMPQKILPILSTIALFFAIYSFSCFTFLGNKGRKFLLPIIIANLSYCVFTLSLVIYFYDSLTILGLIYFIGEIVIILGLIYIEIKAFKMPTNIQS